MSSCCWGLLPVQVRLQLLLVVGSAVAMVFLAVAGGTGCAAGGVRFGVEAVGLLQIFLRLLWLFSGMWQLRWSAWQLLWPAACSFYFAAGLLGFWCVSFSRFLIVVCLVRFCCGVLRFWWFLFLRTLLVLTQGYACGL